eukprot:g1350.t1
MRALKTLYVDETEDHEKLKNEISLLAQMDHPHIVKFYEYYCTQFTKKTGRYYLLMEYCAGGELFDALMDQSKKHFNEKTACKILQSILSAVSYLHSKGIVHRDLKLENFVLTDKKDVSNLKLIDFGLSTKYTKKGGEKLHERLGTIFYVAPEVLNENYDEKCDIWSIGVIAYMLLSGKCPWTKTDQDDIMDEILDGEIRYPKYLWKKYSANCVDFVKTLLQKDPKKRPDARNALDHPWMHAMDHSTHHIDHKVLGNLKNFIYYPKFKKAALKAIAFSKTDTEIKKLREAFEEIDTEKQGVLTWNEFHDVMAENKVSESEIKEAFEMLDHDHNAYINYTDFIAAAMSKKNYMDEQSLHMAFYEFDRERKGFISKKDLHAILGDTYDVVEIEKMMIEAEFQNPEKVSFDEFASFLKQETKRRGSLYKKSSGALLKALHEKKKSLGVIPKASGETNTKSTTEGGQ